MLEGVNGPDAKHVIDADHVVVVDRVEGVDRGDGREGVNNGADVDCLQEQAQTVAPVLRRDDGDLLRGMLRLRWVDGDERVSHNLAGSPM